MASINEKLNYINETKSLIKDKLNDLGSEIENETTFREYAEKIEDLYEEWPKVNDEDTTITLNDTKKGKILLQLKGNINQFTTTGKNLYNKYGDFNYPTNAYTKGTYLLEDGTIKTTANNASNSSRGIRMFFKENTNYTISCDLLSSTGVGTIARVRIMGYDNGWKEITGISYTEIGTQYKTFSSGTYTDFFISLNSNGPLGGQYEAIFDNIQIEEGTVHTTYEPYTGGIESPNPDYPQNIKIVTGENIISISNENNTENQIFTINLGNIELCKNENNEDFIYKENHKWYQHKKFNKIILNNLTWAIRDWGFNGGVLNNSVPAPNNNSIAKIWCSCFANKTANNVYHLIGDINKGIALSMSKDLIIRDIDITTLEELNSIINNQILYYILETPLNIEITDTVLINQLNTLEQAMSYDTQTDISQENDNLPFIINATALMKNSD